VQAEALRGATADLAWLLGRGYPDAAALKLVGDRYRLVERQRMAVRRATCTDAARLGRQARRLEPGAIAGRALAIDGFNVLTTIEAALGGAVVLACRDGTYRDLAGVHGTYRRVAETRPALGILAECLAALGVASCVWYLDRPVSNSGRLRAEILGRAEEDGADWRVELVPSADPCLIASREVVASADSGVLDRCGPWFNLARSAVEAGVPAARVVDLSA
jgi:hypothetical protein